MRNGAAFDLVVRGGTVVTAGSRSQTDLGIRGEQIAQIGGEMIGAREIDVTGCYVVPGGIDMHVHLSATRPGPDEPNGFVDDFLTGSRAALRGGITTMGQMSFAEDGWLVRDAVERDLRAAGEQSLVDFVLHPGLISVSDDDLAAIPELADQGHLSLKLVTLALDWDYANIVAAVRRAGQAGMLTLVHCEDEALIDFLSNDLVAQGEGGLEHYPRSRPDYTEKVAVDRVIGICEATGSPILIVHLSSAAALASARAARQRGLPVFVETRPIYLHLTEVVHCGPDSGKYIGMPPVRSASDVDALWHGLADGSIDTIASDHAPWTLEQKLDSTLDVITSRKGVADLETMLPMLFSSGVLTGRISLERYVAVSSTNPARLFGLYPRKGTIAIASDADLVVIDPTLTRVVDGAEMESAAGYSVYDETAVTGWPRWTISRGEVVLDDGQIHGEPGRGNWLPRSSTVRVL